MSNTVGRLQDSATRISMGNAITAEDLASRGLRAGEDVARYALILGDDSLMLAQRLGHWISRAPELEEDVALADLPWTCWAMPGSCSPTPAPPGTRPRTISPTSATEEFRSARLVEQENGDFAQTIARQLIFSFYSNELYTRLLDSTDETLSAIADKALKEVDYHRDHAAQWLRRLGGGTEESHRRMQTGLDTVWTYIEELFVDVEPTTELAAAGVAVLPSTLREDVLNQLSSIIDEAGLRVPQAKGAFGADRSGRFSEHRGFILAEMQVLAREHPGATW